MTVIHLVCPKCRNPDAHEESDIDTSKEITCSACGFSELPTVFELAKRHETKSRQLTKIGIIIVAVIVFAFLGLSVIALAAFYVPIIIIAVIVLVLYRR
jgi:hypothetical protein